MNSLAFALSPLKLLYSKWDARWSDIDAGSHTRQEQEFKGVCRNRGLLCDGDNTRSSPHMSVVTLGCFI